MKNSPTEYEKLVVENKALAAQNQLLQEEMKEWSAWKEKYDTMILHESLNSMYRDSLQDAINNPNSINHTYQSDHNRFLSFYGSTIKFIEGATVAIGGPLILTEIFNMTQNMVY